MYRAKRFLVTSALPYANGPLHIGHLAGAYLPADIYVRFQRMMGKDIVFVCGSDEHGAAITIRATKENKSPQEIIDKYDAIFRDSFAKMGVSFDIYHRTSADIHHATAQDFFRVLNENGEFIEKESEQYYDEEAKQFLADRYIKGKCPKCHEEGAYGDQCEKCGSALSPTELINPISTITGNVPILKKTRHWYLPLDRYESWLREWIETGQLDGKELHEVSQWKNHVVGQCKSWLDGGLQPRAMTRDLDWGVDVPPEIKGAEGKKLYVWMDAPIGYISATKQWALDHNKDWQPYWKDEDTALVHFIGKDNIVFHCLIFPAILRANGSYILPKNVPANQFMNLEGNKISTSKNWAVWVHEYLEDMPDKVDELRYSLIKNMPEQKDSEFTWKGYQDNVNGELVNNLANFVNRVIVLTNKYYDGIVPDFDENQEFIGFTDPELGGYHETELIQLFDDLSDLCQHIRDFDFRAGLKSLMEISSKGNQLLQFNEPWKQQKTNPELVKAVMNLSIQIVGALSLVMKPFLPHSADRLRSILNLDPITENGELLEMLNNLAEGQLIIPNGHKLNKSQHLFTRIEDSTIDNQISKLEASTPMSEEPIVAQLPNIKETISFDDFTKIDIRTAKILTAEKHPKADRLLKLEVDLGLEKRTVVSGIAEFFKPEEIIGKEVCLLANLAPRKIRGIESEGMILMSEDTNGKLSFVSAQKGWESGQIVR